MQTEAIASARRTDAGSHRQRLILRLLRRPEQRPARRLLARLHPADLARLVPLLTTDEQDRLLATLVELRLAGRVLTELGADTQATLLAKLDDPALASLLGPISPNDAVDLLERLAPERAQMVMALMERPAASQLANLMHYGASTAGGLMDPEAPHFSAEQTVDETLRQVRHLAEGRRLFYLYITDERNHLLGIVSLWQLVTAGADRPLRAIMSTEVVTVRVDTPEDEVAQVFSRYDLLMIPVVDGEGRFTGAITVDDVLDVVEAQATQDIYRLANLSVQEGVATPAMRSVRLRLPWLLVNLATAFLAASVVSSFQETISKYVVLAVFMPIVAGMGGNAGTQTLTVMVRALALGEMDVRRAGSVLARQTVVGLMNGIATGLVLGLVALAWERNAILAGVLCFAETVNLTIAGFFGAGVPLVLRRLNLDPALGSSIFVTTATDVCGFLAFLGTATYLLARLHP
ncbi:MAG: magnesium transporter [Thermoanaerobaculia bacterium]